MRNRKNRQRIFLGILAAVVAMAMMQPGMGCAAQSGNQTPATETIVMIRHGEKPQASLGQLNCKGLNRALALPGVLLTRFGKPDYVFAPDPADQIDNNGKLYSYVRPLATIEPTAIRAGLPVNTQMGFSDIAGLQEELTQPVYAGSLIFVAWEHGYLNKFARQFLHSQGNPAVVPYWTGDDYDTIYVFKLTRETSGQTRLSFHMEHEGLNHSLSDACPAK